MSFSEFLQNHPFIKKHLISLACSCIGLVLIGYGLIGSLGQSLQKSNDPVRFETEPSSSSEKHTESIKTSIYVDISGAVKAPGVYSMPSDSRLQDGLVAAGGLADEADADYVAKQLNLASKLSDGQKVYVPAVGESTTPLRQGFEGQAGTTSSLGINDELVNINSASQSQIEDLPGVGPVTAEKIIGGRPYTSVDELLSKKIVSKKVFEEIKEKVSTY